MVDYELYEFLKEHECHLYRSKGEVKAWVCVEFRDLKEFIKAVGMYRFDEDGLGVTLKDGYIAVELDDIIDGTGAELSDYKKCFDDEWDCYF